MNDDYTVLLHDLRILEMMAVDMAAYLDSDVSGWVIPRSNMPKLTIGGYLMREHRLKALSAQLQPADWERLQAAVEAFNQALIERVVRFEKRAHQELHKRISEWISYLRDLGSQVTTEKNYFVGIVDTRVVITSLIDKLKKPPYHLEKGVLNEVEALDKNLQARTAEHSFIWDAVWEPAYPADKYWWLYCCPTRGEQPTE